MFSHRYSAGLDDAATVELLSSTGGSASALAAYEAKKGAREHEGNKINSALQKLEKVRFRLFERLSDSDEPACKKETYARRRWINVETTRLKVVQAIRDFSQESGSVTLLRRHQFINCPGCSYEFLLVLRAWTASEVEL